MVVKQEDLDISKFIIEEVEGNGNFKKAWFNYSCHLWHGSRVVILKIEKSQ